MQSTPSSFCAPIMSAPRVQSEVAEPCQLSPPSSSRASGREARRRFIVELGSGLRLARSRPQAGARGGGQGEKPEKFATLQNYWFTGESASRSSATRSLICSSVSVPESPSRGICEQRLYALAL